MRSLLYDTVILDTKSPDDYAWNGLLYRTVKSKAKILRGETGFAGYVRFHGVVGVKRRALLVLCCFTIFLHLCRYMSFTYCSYGAMMRSFLFATLKCLLLQGAYMKKVEF